MRFSLCQHTFLGFNFYAFLAFFRVDIYCILQGRREGESKGVSYPGPPHCRRGPAIPRGRKPAGGAVSDRSFPRAPNWLSTGIKLNFGMKKLAPIG